MTCCVCKFVLFSGEFAVLLVYLPSCLGQETAKWPFRSSSCHLLQLV